MPAKLISFSLLIAFLSIFSYVYWPLSYPELPENLLFQRIDGYKHTLKKVQGKPVLVTFWSPSCILCLKEVNHFNQLYSKHQGGKKFEMLALSMYYDRPDWVIQSSKELKMSYPVYFDLTKNLSQAFGDIVATPTSFIINSAGKIVYKHTGRSDYDLLDQKLTELIG